jgi:hypothetical protein
MVVRLGENSPICAHWVIVYIGRFLGRKLQKRPTFFGQLYSTVMGMSQLCTKMAWATFWAIFSETHLVNLTEMSEAHS